jgi:beta-glucanase (GH16 family)
MRRDRRHGELRHQPGRGPRNHPRARVLRRRRVTASLDTGSPLADDFHVYAVSWELDRIRWYADHTLYHTVTPADLQGNPWVFDHGFYLLINVALGGRFSAPPDPSAAFPQTMLIDYIRVYTA